MRLLKIIIVFAFCLAFTARAEARVFDAESFTLENGLQVVVIPNHRAPVVTHMIWYKFGGGDEQAGKSGIAHFLEHLMFKGTPSYPDGSLSSNIKKLGGNDNAFTTHDFTAYYQNVPRDHLELAMRMEADRMKNLVLDEKEVLSERDVIIEERKQRIDNQPQAKFQEQINAALFVNHPYGTPVIGWLHEMQGLTREDALENYKKWYAPNNAIVIVSGDITAAELKPLAIKYYGDIARQDIPKRERTLPAPLIAQNNLIMQDVRVGRPLLIKAYRAPRGSDTLEMITEILGGSSTSRLYKNLVVDKKLAVSIGAEYDPIALNNTTLTIYASPTPNTSIPELETALDQEIKQFAASSITDEELKSAKDKKKASLIYYVDSLQGPAILFGRVLASGFDMGYIQNWETRIAKITAQDVSKQSKDFFATDNIPVTGLLLPEQSKAQEKAE